MYGFQFKNVFRTSRGESEASHSVLSGWRVFVGEWYAVHKVLSSGAAQEDPQATKTEAGIWRHLKVIFYAHGSQ